MQQSTKLQGTRPFPVDLLEASIDEKLSFFKEYIITHPRAEKALKDTLDYIFNPSKGYMLIVIGPAGSGKSTLLDEIAARLLQHAQTDIKFHPGRLPVVNCRAMAPEDSKGFRWLAFYRDLLLLLHDIAIERKISYKADTVEYGPDGKPRIKRDSYIDALKSSCISALEWRNPYGVCVDEAHHLRYIGASQSLQTQMDILKDLSDITKTLFMLFGTYELLELTNLSAQLGRRTKIVPLFAYTQAKDDIKAFKAIIRSLVKALPLRNEPDLTHEFRFLFEGSLGCIGLLKPWMLEALKITLKDEANISYLDALKETAYSLKELVVWAETMTMGERAFRTSERDLTNLRNILSRKSQPDPVTVTGFLPNETPQKPRANHTKPGKRGPHRDPVPSE